MLYVAGFFLDKPKVSTFQANILLEDQVVINEITTPKKDFKRQSEDIWSLSYSEQESSLLR